MSRTTLPLLLATLACTGTAHAAGITLHSHKGGCQITVPADWHVGEYLKSSADSPDRKMSAVISTSGTDSDLAFAKKVMEGSYPPVQVYEDTPNRLFYRYTAAGGKIGYYVGVPGPNKTVCGAQISAHAGQDAIVKQIAASVAPSP